MGLSETDGDLVIHVRVVGFDLPDRLDRLAEAGLIVGGHAVLAAFDQRFGRPLRRRPAARVRARPSGCSAASTALQASRHGRSILRSVRGRWPGRRACRPLRAFPVAPSPPGRPRRLRDIGLCPIGGWTGWRGSGSAGVAAGLCSGRAGQRPGKTDNLVVELLGQVHVVLQEGRSPRLPRAIRRISAGSIPRGRASTRLWLTSIASS